MHRNVSPSLISALLVVIPVISALATLSAKIQHFELLPDVEITHKAIDYRLNDRATAVLVLMPGCNGNGRKLILEASWAAFAEEKNFSLAGITFKTPEDVLKRKKGYYDASLGSGQALVTLLEKTGMGNLPIILFGFSGGAHFVSSFAESHPNRTFAWCAYSAAWWGDVGKQGHSAPPGIIACGGEDIRLGASLTYFKSLRADGRPVSWIELPNTGHSRNNTFEDFVRDWFSAEQERRKKRRNGIWCDLGNGDVIDENSICNKVNKSWFPSIDTLNKWRTLVSNTNCVVLSKRFLTKAAKVPSMTIFLSSPIEHPNGVLCLSLLANRPSDVEWVLRKKQRHGTVGKLMKFAETNSMCILAWGAPRGLWKPRYNWDGIERKENKELKRTFSAVARSWDNAIDSLIREYNLPPSNFLMAGFSGAAQFAQRLALHCPKRFSAVAIHVASSYDYPVENGRNILWCVTTGENESGYMRSLRFLRAAIKNEYPIIYKAYPGLGHSDSNYACDLAISCFNYMISQKNGRPSYPHEWAYAADVINQRCITRNDMSSIPNCYRIFIPDAKVAEAWKRY